MDAPRFAGNPRAAAWLAALVVLAGPLLARADRTVSDDRGRDGCAPPVRNDATRNQPHREREPAHDDPCDDRPEAITLPPSLLLHCLRCLQVLQSVCALWPDLQPASTPPLVVKPPQPTPKPPTKPGPRDEPTPAEHTPEPGTIVGGLVASAVGLAAWWRRRKREGDDVATPA